MPILIKSARVIDPGHLDDIRDVLISQGRIETLQPPGTLAIGSDGVQVIDAQGLWLTPGLIDMHVHFREPGQEYKETIRTGAQAATPALSEALRVK